MESKRVSKETVIVVDYNKWKTTIELEFVVICVIGDHAGQKPEEFFASKMSDIMM